MSEKYGVKGKFLVSKPFDTFKMLSAQKLELIKGFPNLKESSEKVKNWLRNKGSKYVNNVNKKG